MRQRAIIFGMVAALLLVAGCQCAPTEKNVTWQAPEGAWAVDAEGAGDDVSFTLENRGPDAATLAHLAVENQLDFWTPEDFTTSLRVGSAKPADLVERLNKYVYEHMALGRHTEEIKRLASNPLAAMLMVGEGEAEDLARELALLAQTAGLEAKLFGMDKHFATAIKWDGAWRLADPTYGFVFFDEETMTYPSLGELALRQPLVKKNIGKAPRWKGKGDVLELYEWYLQQDAESRLMDVFGKAEATPPWPLPGGASVTFDYDGEGMREGVWRFVKIDDWFGKTPEWITAKGFVERLYGFGPVERPPTGVLRFTVDLPHPVNRAALRLIARPPEGALPRTEVFVLGPKQGASDANRVLEESHDYATPLVVDYRFPRSVSGPVTIEVHILPAALFVTGVEIELGFTHGVAAGAPVAGNDAKLAARATTGGQATLAATHRYR
jgi:hypothetical protein